MNHLFKVKPQEGFKSFRSPNDGVDNAIIVEEGEQKLKIEYDKENPGIVTIEGRRFAFEFFKCMAQPRQDVLYEITEKDGVIKFREYLLAEIINEKNVKCFEHWERIHG